MKGLRTAARLMAPFGDQESHTEVGPDVFRSKSFCFQCSTIENSCVCFLQKKSQAAQIPVVTQTDQAAFRSDVWETRFCSTTRKLPRVVVLCDCAKRIFVWRCPHPRKMVFYTYK